MTVPRPEPLVVRRAAGVADRVGPARQPRRSSRSTRTTRTTPRSRSLRQPNRRPPRSSRSDPPRCPTRRRRRRPRRCPWPMALSSARRHRTRGPPQVSPAGVPPEPVPCFWSSAAAYTSFCRLKPKGDNLTLSMRCLPSGPAEMLMETSGFASQDSAKPCSFWARSLSAKRLSRPHSGEERSIRARAAASPPGPTPAPTVLNPLLAQVRTGLPVVVAGGVDVGDGAARRVGVRRQQGRVVHRGRGVAAQQTGRGCRRCPPAARTNGPRSSAGP